MQQPVDLGRETILNIAYWLDVDTWVLRDIAALVLKDAVVTEFIWINPHPLIKADYKDEQGNVQHWTMEMGSTVSAQLLGWSRTTLNYGDVVTLYVWQAKTKVPVGRFNKVVFADGTTMRDTQTGADDGKRADTDVRQ